MPVVEDFQDACVNLAKWRTNKDGLLMKPVHKYALHSSKYAGEIGRWHVGKVAIVVVGVRADEVATHGHRKQQLSVDVRIDKEARRDMRGVECVQEHERRAILAALFDHLLRRVRAGVVKRESDFAWTKN